MTSLLARLGQFESRKVTQTIWNTGKRKRPEWVCAQCQTRKALRQRRGYSEDAARYDGASCLFSGKAEDWEYPQERDSDRSKVQGGDGSAWGLRANTRQQTDTASVSVDQEQRFKSNRALSGSNAHDAELTLPWDQLAGQVHDLEADEDASEDISAIQELADHNLPSITDDALLDLDYRQTLAAALANDEADRVVRCLYAANLANDLKWLQAISATTFSEIIRLLQPSNFTAQTANAHIELSTSMVAQMGIAPMRQIAFEYTLVLRQIIAIRRSVGASLSIDDYTALLRGARDLGNQRMSANLFGNLLKDGLEPSTSCYNSYISAVVWNGIHSAGSRQKVRVTPFHMMGRKLARPRTSFANYRVGTGGVREVAMKIFNDMLAHGATPNEETFRILITAAAREGDVDIVKSMLNKVWNIDVAAIMQGQNEPSLTPKALPEHSPLHPTTALLFTIAHAFGINNDIPAALRTVDFVARHYNVTVTDQVWSQLFEWTFVLSIRRWGRNRTNGSMTGQLPPESLMSLWDTMTGPPYHVQPSIGMYNYLIKNLFRRSWTPRLVEKMHEGIRLYQKHRHTANRRSRQLKAAIQSQGSDGKDKTIERLRNDWEYADLIRRRDRFWVHRWVRLLLGSFQTWHRQDHDHQLFCRVLPALLWQWRAFAPTIVRYETPTGFVEFAIRTEDEMVHSAKVRAGVHKTSEDLIRSTAKYVGNTWLQGRGWKPPKRMMEDRPALQHEDDIT